MRKPKGMVVTPWEPVRPRSDARKPAQGRLSSSQARRLIRDSEWLVEQGYKTQAAHDLEMDGIRERLKG